MASDSQAGPDKGDRGLRQALDTHAAPQSVIVSVNPGCRARVRQAIEPPGDAVRSEHDLIDALAAHIPSGDVDAPASSSCVKTVSIDATVRADGATFNSTSTVLDASASLQTATTTNTLRDTLGLPHSLVGGEYMVWGEGVY